METVWIWAMLLGSILFCVVFIGSLINAHVKKGSNGAYGLAQAKAKAAADKIGHDMRLQLAAGKDEGFKNPQGEWEK